MTAAAGGRVVGLDHLQLAIPVGGEEIARAFYGGLLGLAEILKPPSLAGRGGCWFALGPVLQLHLGVEASFAPAGKAHPGLLVDDLAGLVGRLAAAGVPAVPDDLLPGHVRAYVADPFGNRVELLQPVAASGTVAA